MTDAPGNQPKDSTERPEPETVEQTQARLAAENQPTNPVHGNDSETLPLGGASANGDTAQLNDGEAPAATTAAPAANTGPAASTPPARSKSIGVVAALAVGALVGGVSGAGVAMWAGSNNGSDSNVGGSNPTSITVNDPNDATQITAVAAKASPSVVTIAVAADGAGGTGSGVFLTKDGYILTNTHVVTLDGASNSGVVRVTTNNGRIYDAEIVGTDPISDLAVIKIEGDDFQAADFADSSKLNVGDTAIAIGAPLGLAGTVTSGVVSALNRSITVASSAVPDEDAPTDEAPTPESPFDFWQFDVPGQQQAPSSSSIALSVIQTDAAINPGNSGGALLNSDGDVIGINVAIASAGSSSGQGGSIGVGFAIPANLAQRVADELIANGVATHGLLGANVLDVTEDETQADSAVVGASIREVTQGGAAEKAGLRAGDIITQFNGIPITGKTDLTAQVRSLAAGATAEVTFVRDGKADTVEVTLGKLEQ